MKFKLVEEYEPFSGDIDYYINLIDMGPNKGYNYQSVMDASEFIDILISELGREKVSQILQSNGYLELDNQYDEDDQMYDAMHDMEFLDFYYIPEFQVVITNSIFPILDDYVEDKKSWERERKYR